MPLKRFGDHGEAFHLSMLSSYISFCELATKFTYVYGIAPEYRSVKMLNGTMLHHAIKIIHTKNMLDSSENALKELIRECWRTAEYETKDYETSVRWPDDPFEKEDLKKKLTDEAVTILSNYCQAPHNRECEVLLNEAEFTLLIADKYKIEGRIDQLRKLPNGQLEIVDFKSGKSPVPSDIQLARDVQLNGYPIAVERGLFQVNGENKNIGQLPDIITYYNLRDHLEYQKPTPVFKLEDRNGNMTSSYQDWFTNIAETHTMDEIRVLTGNNRLSAKTKVYFNTGHQKGPGRHSIELTEHRRTVMEKAIQWACASMRLNIYKPNRAACSSCRHTDTCERYLDGIDKNFVADNDFLPEEYYQLI